MCSPLEETSTSSLYGISLPLTCFIFFPTQLTSFKLFDQLSLFLSPFSHPPHDWSQPLHSCNLCLFPFHISSLLSHNHTVKRYCYIKLCLSTRSIFYTAPSFTILHFPPFLPHPHTHHQYPPTQDQSATGYDLHNKQRLGIILSIQWRTLVFELRLNEM